MQLQYELALAQTYGKFYEYASVDAFSDRGKKRDGDINGVYIKRELLEDAPPPKIQITLKW